MKLNKRTDKLAEEKEAQIVQLLQLNSKNEKEMQKMK